MVRSTETQITALILTVICILTSVMTSALGSLPVEHIALSPDCTLFARLAYSFFHASVFHAFINCWCLLSIVYIYDVSPTHLLIAFLAAITAPIGFLDSVSCGFLTGTYTVGLSAVVFTLLGIVSFQTKRKLYFHTWVASFIAVGFLLPYLCSVCGITIATPNNFLHIYSYVVGLLVGFLNSPPSWKRK